MKKLCVFVLILFSCELFAQEDYNAIIQQQSIEIARLYQDINQMKGTISERRKQLFNMRLSWYNTCVEYLKAGQNNFKVDELDKLLKDTKIEIDGEELYDELYRARECMRTGEAYTYREITPPSMELSKPDKDDKNKKNVTPPKTKEKPSKKDGKNEKKDKDDKKSPIEKPDNPTPPVERTPRVGERPIESDPNKDKPGDEKPIVETPVKKETPIVEPEKPEKKDPVQPSKRSPQKVDKGEIEEGIGAKTKNNDGSN